MNKPNLQGDVSSLCSLNLTKDALASPWATTAAGQLVVHTHLISGSLAQQHPSSDPGSWGPQGGGQGGKVTPYSCLSGALAGVGILLCLSSEDYGENAINPHCVLQVLLVKRAVGRKGCQRKGNLGLIQGLVPWHRGLHWEQSLREVADWQINRG